MSRLWLLIVPLLAALTLLALPITIGAAGVAICRPSGDAHAEPPAAGAYIDLTVTALPSTPGHRSVARR
jgi:hypothetical protein